MVTIVAQRIHDENYLKSLTNTIEHLEIYFRFFFLRLNTIWHEIRMASFFSFFYDLVLILGFFLFFINPIGLKQKVPRGGNCLILFGMHSSIEFIVCMSIHLPIKVIDQIPFFVRYFSSISVSECDSKTK